MGHQSVPPPPRPSGPRPRRRSATFLSYALPCLLAFPWVPAEIHAQAGADGRDDPSILEVSGSAEVMVPADRALLSLAVETEGATAREAAGENAERMDRVIGALRELRAEGLELETHGYALQPRYTRPAPDRTGPPRIEGYRVTNHLRVRADDVDRIGELIDVGVEAGANRVASIHFQVRDTEAAREEALREAVRKARREAEVIADAMGVELGAPLEIRGGADFPSPRSVAWAAEMAVEDAAVRTPVEPAAQRVSANVTVRYRLGN